MQSADHRERGVARYVFELARALDRLRPDVVGRFLLNPDLALPPNLEPLLATGRLAHSDRCDPPHGGLLHVMSPYELAVPLERLWPAFAARARLRLVVTVFDVIPELFPERYLADAGLRRRYRARHALVRAADHVVTISRCSADDAVEHLGLDPGKVTVVGAGTSERFRPPSSRAAAAAAARSLVPGLAGPFVLYTGGIEERKNIDRLLAAWSMLPPATRDGWQLVIACQADELQRRHYEHRAAALGIAGRLLLPGYLPDATLVTLYQGTDLFVFPSLYEGYGLPVAEALACGAPTVAARTPALAELVDEGSLFDPYDPGAIAGAIHRGLTDDVARRHLLEATERRPPSWDDVARRTLEVYDALLSRPPLPPRRRRPLVAVASPLPPRRTGVARYSYRLIDALRAHCDVDAFVEADGGEGPPEAPAGVEVFPVDVLERVGAARGGYDEVLYCLGNSEFHAGALAALRRCPGVVLAHDVRLTDLYALSAWRSDAVPGGFHAAVQRMYGGRVPPELGRTGRLRADEAERFGVLMAREVVALSRRFFTTSDFASALARLDAEPHHAGRVGVLPFAVHAPAPGEAGGGEGDAASGGPVMATFGVVNEIKQPAKVVEAFAHVLASHPGAHLAVVGPASEEDARRVLGLAAELGVAGSVEVMGDVPDEDYLAWLRRATVAVQLRAASNGESSAAVGDCLAAGVATVVAAIGAARDLPDDCVVKVDADVSAEDLAAQIAALLADGPRRRRLGQAAAAYAAENSFERLAEVIYRTVLTG